MCDSYVRKKYVWVDIEKIRDRLDFGFYSPEQQENEKKIVDYGNYLRLNEVTLNRRSEPQTESNDFINSGIDVIRMSDIRPFEISFENTVKISEEVFLELSEFKLLEGMLIFGLTGVTLGRVVIIPKGIRKCITNRRIAQLEMKPEYDTYYLGVFLNSVYGQLQLFRYSTGVAQPNLRLEDTGEILVPIPTPEIQKYIGDKVRKAEELKEEASQLKKEMEDIITTQLKLDDLQSELNDIKDKFVWESIGNIIGRLDSIYYRKQNIKTVNHMKNLMGQHKYLSDFVETINTGKKPTFKERGEEVFFVQSGNISNNFLEFNETIKVDISSYKTLNFGDILVAKDGETIGKIAVNFSNNKSILNEHTYCLKLKEQYKAYGAYIYYLFTNKALNNLIRRESTGSAQKGLNQDFVNWIPVPLIDEMEIIRIMNTEKRRCNNIYEAEMLIKEAKQDIEDLIEGTFDMSKLNENSIERR